MQRVHILKHEPNEWIGSMRPWFEEKGYQLTTCEVYNNETLPQVDDFDWLIIMGGNMSVYQEDEYPWLVPEKQLLREAIAADKKIIGICLGGQMIASALGADVSPGVALEIGWYPLEKTNEIASWLPNGFSPLSWHGDRFLPPDGAVSFCQSSITPHQGFCIGNKVWGLQFHLEATDESIPAFYETSGSTLPEGEFVQSYHQLIETSNTNQSAEVMSALLDIVDAA